MSAESILTTARQYLRVSPNTPVTIEPIRKGASGRTIVRVKTEGREPFIGIHWTDERPDSDFYPEVSRFLSKAGIQVPEMLHEALKWNVVLVEDLGDVDLLSLKGRPWGEREPYYRSALGQLDKLFYTRAGKDMEFSPPFDAEMYRWEQEYFIEHMVEGMLEMDGSELRESPALKDLANRLGAGAKNLVHRDFKAQNFMLRDDKVYWIDFQGMRRGRQEYDLASLIYDIDMDHPQEEREKLLDLWEEISEERPVAQIFQECAAQRLMQAMGAYGNIIRNRKNEWYRQHLPVAARMLDTVVRGMAIEDVLKPAIEKGKAL